MERWRRMQTMQLSPQKRWHFTENLNTFPLFVFARRAGQVQMSTALGLTAYLDKEREYVPWSSALSHLGFIGSMLSMRPSYGNYRVSQGYLLSLLPIVPSGTWGSNEVLPPGLSAFSKLQSSSLSFLFTVLRQVVLGVPLPYVAGVHSSTILVMSLTSFRRTLPMVSPFPAPRSDNGAHIKS